MAERKGSGPAAAQRAIWLAGLGALAAAEVEGEGYFVHLVELGEKAVRQGGRRFPESEVREPAASEALLQEVAGLGDPWSIEDLGEVTGLVGSFPSQLYLSRLQALFALSLTELAALFGVSRQAVSKWLQEGVPPARLPKLLTVLDTADLLARQLQSGRLPAVVRRPAAAWGGRSMLELITADRHQELLTQVERSFDWAATA